jgi:hypothetical protein
VVRRAAVFEDGAVMCPLEGALPLRGLLAPVSHSAQRIADALDALMPAQSRLLALGSALHAIMDYLVCPLAMTWWQHASSFANDI